MTARRLFAAVRVVVDPRGEVTDGPNETARSARLHSGACATNWPPLRASGKPTVGSGTQASMASTTKRSDGSRQVTYNGHPLYRFQGDHTAGDTNGQGVNAFGAAWYVVSPAGSQITAKPSSSDSSSSGGGSGY